MTTNRLYATPDGRVSMHQPPACPSAPIGSPHASPLIIGRVLRLAALPTAPRIARMFVAQVSHVAGLSRATAETAQLLVSELVTNAARVTGRVDGPPVPLPAEHVAVLYLLVRAGNGKLRVDVWDADPRPPVMEQAKDTDETGRGLLLVEALSAAWGAYTPRGAGASGKVVWAEVTS